MKRMKRAVVAWQYTDEVMKQELGFLNRVKAGNVGVTGETKDGNQK
jgi:hypothetical protein